MKKALIALLQIAIENKASDIHISVEQGKATYELRILGKLVELQLPQVYQDDRLFHYLKYISHCELSDALTPQSGSFELSIDERKYAMRFAIMATRYKQVGVIRILNQGIYFSIEQLSPDVAIQQRYREMLQLENGLVIVSGSTGSGKSTTCYSLLNHIENRKIYTIEDPIEIHYPNLMQVQVNVKAGLDYNAIIKQIMRHDPDVIFIGEIRDEAAAMMAVRSALTGHLVFATIHASSPVGAYYRLIDLNCNPVQLMTVLSYITCQRLLVNPITNTRYAKVEIMNNQQINAFVHPGHYYAFESAPQVPAYFAQQGFNEDDFKHS